MNSAAVADKPSDRSVAGIAGAAGGLILFALFAHRGIPCMFVGMGGLGVAAWAIVWTGFGIEHPAVTLGLTGWSGRMAWLSIAGIAFGIALGMAQRFSLDLPLWPPPKIQPFVGLACLIGATEELIYRGWILGQARKHGWLVALVAAAAAHAAYKTALFVWPRIAGPFDLPLIALLSFAGGVAFGWLRLVSGSLVPSIMAHVAFDFMVYRAVARPPWWVWG